MKATPYEALMDSAARLADVEALADVDEADVLAASSLIAQNRLALESARRALGPNCVVPMRYEEGFVSEYLDHLSHVRSLALAFRLEAWFAASSNDFRAAGRIGMDILELANAARRGGLLTGLLVSNAISGIALESLRRIRNQLDGATRPLMIRELHRLDREREPFTEIASRDRAWEIAVGCEEEKCDFTPLETMDWGEGELSEEEQKEIVQLMQKWADLPKSELREMQWDQDHHILALMRMLVVDLALRGYHDDSGSYPDELSRLIPWLLGTLPRDPYTEDWFIYRRSGIHSFHLYSTGPKLTDGGGHFGPWPMVAAGFADLCLDADDYWPDGCTL